MIEIVFLALLHLSGVAAYPGGRGGNGGHGHYGGMEGVDGMEVDGLGVILNGGHGGNGKSGVKGGNGGDCEYPCSPGQGGGGLMETKVKKVETAVKLSRHATTVIVASMARFDSTELRALL